MPQPLAPRQLAVGHLPPQPRKLPAVEPATCLSQSPLAKKRTRELQKRRRELGALASPAVEPAICLNQSPLAVPEGTPP